METSKVVMIVNSTVIVGNSGNTAVSSGPTDEMEQELLRSFRSLTIRDRVEVMQAIYEKQKSSLR